MVFKIFTIFSPYNKMDACWKEIVVGEVVKYLFTPVIVVHGTGEGVKCFFISLTTVLTPKAVGRK